MAAFRNRRLANKRLAVKRPVTAAVTTLQDVGCDMPGPGLLADAGEDVWQAAGSDLTAMSNAIQQ